MRFKIHIELCFTSRAEITLSEGSKAEANVSKSKQGVWCDHNKQRGEQ